MHATLNSVSNERSARRFWVTFILSFFCMDLVIAIIAIVMAAGDPSFRSIPGFGHRAVAWDERRQLVEAWQQQGWDVNIRRTLPNFQAFEIQIMHNGDPVVQCTGTVKLFHYTRVAEQKHQVLEETSPGIYRANCDVSKPGLWNVEVELLTPDKIQCWNSFTMEWMESVGTREASQ